MTWQMVLVFGLLAITFALMVWEKLSLDIVAMLAFSALLAVGILTPAEAFKVFSERVKPEIGTGAVRVVGSSPHKGNAEILKAEMLKWDRKTARPPDH